MELNTIIKNLYINKESNWIMEIEDNEISPFVIQQWLVMNDSIRVQVRWLDKYVFPLQNNPKMFLSLAWSIIPKSQKVPYVKWIKKLKTEEEYSFILDRVRKHMNLSDNDYNSNKSRILKLITKDSKSMVEWFSFYGIPKNIWKKYYLDFNEMKKFGPKKEIAQKGLASWGI